MSPRTSIKLSQTAVSAAVLEALTDQEQPLRDIRAQAAKSLGVKLEVVQGRVSRALSQLVASGMVKRPKRGIYCLAHSADLETAKTPQIPIQLTKPLVSSVVPQTPAMTKVKPIVVPKQQSFEVGVQPQDSPPPLAVEIAQVLPEAQPVPRTISHYIESDLPPLQPSNKVTQCQEMRVTRRERVWTPCGSMGVVGMMLIWLWLVTSGVAFFFLGNTVGVLVAVGIAGLFWLIHRGARPKHR